MSSTRRSSKFGTVNYSADEMRRLNAKVRAVLPLVGEEWLRVAYQFNYQRSESVPYREVESLKRKFKKMYCTRGKALPDYVVEAKELRKLIGQRSDKAVQQVVTEEEADKEQVVSTETQEAGDVTLKLRQIEDEYHRILGTTRAEVVEGGATSTSGCISMLRKNMERKRRAAEEQTLTENARVRRERKRRKMEEVLLSIHQEQRDRELAESRHGDGDAETSAADSPPLAAAAAPAIPASTSQPYSIQDPTSLGMMEMLLQFMTAQEMETTRQLEAEQTRREQEQREREKRRRHKELQRQQEHRELMLAMGALLGDRFPDSLKYYLNEEERYHPTASTPPTNHASNLTPGNSNQPPTQSSVDPPVPTAQMTTNRHDTEAGVSDEDDFVGARVQQQAGI